jgi:hypothetical protein
MEIVNSTLTALEEGEINVPQAQQLTGLALAKMNIESRSQEDKAVSKEMEIEEAKEFMAQIKEAKENIEFFREKIQKTKE